MADNDVIPRKIVIPTGFETAEQAIAMRQRLADALMQQGMTTKENMISPLQVLGQLAQEFVGSRLSNRAMREEGQLNQRIREAYQSGLQGLYNDVNSGMSPRDLVEKYSGNPLLGDALKPFSDAMSHGLTEGENLIRANGTLGAAKNFIGKPVFDVGDVVKPSFSGGNLVEQADPTAIAAKGASSPMATNIVPLTAATQSTTIPNAAPGSQPVGGGQPPSTPPAGTPTVSPASLPVPAANPANVAAAIRQRVIGGVGQVESGNRDYYPNGNPVVNPSSGARFRMQVLPSTAHNPGFGVLPARDNSPAEYDRVGEDYLGAMMKRYGNNLPKALGAYNAGPGTMDHAIAAGGPLPAQGYAAKAMGAMGKAPDGMTIDGHPYWIVNGQAYDNPEGR